MIKNDRNLRFGHLGNGLTVYDKNHELNGDYEIVAHINNDRQVSFRVPLNLKDMLDIIYEAATYDGETSFTQSDKIFKVEGENTELSKLIKQIKVDNLKTVTEDYAKCWGATDIEWQNWWEENYGQY